jgi:hypothetical protein
MADTKTHFEEEERIRRSPRREVPHHRSGGGDCCGICGSVEHTYHQHLYGLAAPPLPTEDDTNG